MFDKISRAVKKTVSNAVEKEVEKEVKKEVDKHETAAKKEYNKAMEGYKGAQKITGTMITNFKEFKTSWEKNASVPEQTVFHFAIASYNYCKDQILGSNMVTLILSKAHNLEDSSSPTGLKLGKTNKYLMDQIKEDMNIVKSYLGASYKDDYKFDEKKLTMNLITVKINDKDANVLIQSGGKDFPTPFTLAKNNEGHWKITEFSSFATGCRKPASKSGDF